MPQVEAAGLRINYDVQGEGEPLLLIPYTGADHACYAFQLPAYTEHFSCVAVDLPGSGESEKPPGPYATETYADQVAAFMAAAGIERAHVAGVSLGAGVATHLAARHPERVRSLSLHSAGTAPTPICARSSSRGGRCARGLPTVADVVIQGIFPFCFTPGMYNDQPEFVQGLVDFVRSRPAQPLEAFLAQTDAVLAHDASGVLGQITRAHPDHVRGARHLHLDTIRRPAAGRHRRERDGGVRRPVPRGPARGRRDVQPGDARLPAAATGLTAGRE